MIPALIWIVAVFLVFVGWDQNKLSTTAGWLVIGAVTFLVAAVA